MAPQTASQIVLAPSANWCAAGSVAAVSIALSVETCRKNYTACARQHCKEAFLTFAVSCSIGPDLGRE